MGKRTNAHASRLRRLIERDGIHCHYCRTPTVPTVPGCEAPTDRTIDHKKPRHHGGTNDLDNLVIACRKCNHTKGSIAYRTFRARLRRAEASALLVICQ